MDDKAPDLVGDIELTDQNGGTPKSGERESINRDEGEMAYFGKVPQLKVCIRYFEAAQVSQY